MMMFARGSAAATRSAAGLLPRSPQPWIAMKMWRSRLAPLVKLGFFAMGTQVSVTVAVPGSRARRDDAVAAIGDVERRIQDFGRHWWAWGDGALASINAQLAAGGVAEIPASMRALFARAWAVRQATGGLFDPRVAALVRLWGFHDMAALRDTPPDAARIASALRDLNRAPGYDGGATYGPAPGVGWDFGGIGKGWIVDLALDRLRELGFPDAIVDAGGNLAVRGGRGDRPWRVGIRHPRSPASGPLLLASMVARDEAVNTHADDQRSFDHDGVRYGHILDPTRGRPAQELCSVTVVHPDGTLAEAGGAALYVAGRHGWRRLARKLGLQQVMVMTADGEVQVTGALAARIKPEAGTALRIAG
jgi:thiamine biosynthesis lipoprotein